MSLSTAVSRISCLAFLAALLYAGATQAQQANRNDENEQRTREAHAVSRDVFEKLEKVQELNELEEFDAALRILRNLNNPDKLSEYELAQVLQFEGFVLYSSGDTTRAIASFEAMLEIPSLEPAARKRTLYTLAQLLMSEERFDESLIRLNQWFDLEENPSSTAWVLLGQNHYQLGNYEAMISPIENAIALAHEQGKETKEDWYALLSFAYFQREDYSKVRNLHKILIENWPRKRYWTTIAGAFSELGDEVNLIAAYDALHTQGLLTEESEFVTLAQLYLQREVPYKAAVLLQEQIDAGNVATDARNYRLLSQAWSLAQEDEKAIPALIEAARMTDDGELDVRLGNSYLNLGRYEQCVAAVQRGIEKGGLKKPEHAYISLGMCLYNLRKYREAMNAFQEAGEVPGTRRTATQWINVVRSDMARNREIEFAEAKAREQIEALQNRRAAQQGI